MVWLITLLRTALTPVEVLKLVWELIRLLKKKNDQPK